MGSPTAEHDSTCQSVHHDLVMCSRGHLIPTHVLVFSWCLRHKGLLATLSLVGSKIRRSCHKDGGHKSAAMARPAACNGEEVLNLQPGEQVEVKSEQEVRATLDERGRHRGLLWMPAMTRFCGKRYTVLKRVETIMLESTGELRKMRNTVLLRDVMCEDLYGCDRSCFHYWREVWLRRVP